MDLSKAFDCLDHELLIAKLHAYGFSIDALELIFEYLKDRWQRVNMNKNFSSWSELLMGVPQGSVLGPLLFNVYLNDLLWFTEGEVCNFADDTTLYGCAHQLDTLINSLESDSAIALKWFENNHMKLNPDKCKLIIAGHKASICSIKVGNAIIREQDEVRLLGVKIDNRLSFKSHLEEKLKKANSKLMVINRNKSFLTFTQKKMLLSSFVHSHFSYAPLIWMFHNRDIQNKIDNVQKKSLANFL